MSEVPPTATSFRDESDPPPLPPPLPPLAAQPYVPQYLAYSSATDLPYESARPLARIVLGTYWVMLAVQVALIWPSYATIGQYQAARDSQTTEEMFTRVDIAMIVGGLFYVVAYIALVVFWMMWVHRTYRNLRPLGAEGLAYSPGWAVGYYFIPILNLFRPFQVMRQTWRASDPGHPGGTSWMAVGVPAFLGVWWAMHLVSNIASNISLRVEMRSEDIGVLYGLAWLDFFLLFFDMALVLVEMHLVRSLTDRQDARATALESAVPGAWPGAAYGVPAQGYPPGFYNDPVSTQAVQPYASGPMPAPPSPPAE